MPEAATHPEPGSSRMPMRVLTETALARRIVSGDDRAFAELFRRHRQALYGFCISIVGDQEDAADALQNTMAKAIQALPGESREIKLKPWLFRVAHNQCIDILRARRGTDDIDEHQLPAAVSLEASVATRERLRQLVADLDQLPERQRGALVMRELNDFGFGEIGEALGTSPTAAKQVVYEARCALQELAKGREMECDPVREAISEGDGRVLGGRKIRAHLRTCESCTDFKAGIETRRQDLRALVPPIPLALIASIGGMFGGTGGGGGLAGMLGLGGGQAALGGGAMKAVAVVAVTAGVGAGTVGIVEGTRDSRDSNTSDSRTVADPAPPGTVPAGVPPFGPAGAADRNSPAADGAGGRRPDGRGKTGPGSGRGPKADGRGLPAVPGKPGSVIPSKLPSVDGPGRSEDAPGQSGGSPGRSGEAPGRSGDAPGNSGSAPGHSGEAPGKSGSAPGKNAGSTGPPSNPPGQSQAGSNPAPAVTSPPATGRPASPGNSGNAGSKKSGK